MVTQGRDAGEGPDGPGEDGLGGNESTDQADRNGNSGARSHHGAGATDENAEELEHLARETLDLWQSHLASLARDPDNVALMSRWMTTLTQTGDAFAKGLQSFARDFATASSADRQPDPEPEQAPPADAPEANHHAASPASRDPHAPGSAPASSNVEAQHDHGARFDNEAPARDSHRAPGSAAPRPASGDGGADVAELQQRVALLEERVRRLEAALWDVRQQS